MLAPRKIKFITLYASGLKEELIVDQRLQEATRQKLMKLQASGHVTDFRWQYSSAPKQGASA